MKKILLLWVVLSTILFANTTDATLFSKYYKELTSLDSTQRDVLIKAYSYGSKHNYGYTLAAITWKESTFNTKAINKTDGKHGSYGGCQVLVDTVISRHKLRSKHSINTIKHRLLHDFEYNMYEAVNELNYWKGLYGNQDKAYRKMLASYNAGHNGINKTLGKKYSDDLTLRVSVVRYYISKNQHILNKPETELAKNNTKDNTTVVSNSMEKKGLNNFNNIKTLKSLFS